MILNRCTDHKSAYAYAHAHAHIPIYWNLQKYCNACSAQSFRRSVHVRSPRTPKHDWIGDTHTESESDWGRERERGQLDTVCHCIGWICLPVVTNWARACCCCCPAQREKQFMILAVIDSLTTCRSHVLLELHSFKFSKLFKSLNSTFIYNWINTHTPSQILINLCTPKLKYIHYIRGVKTMLRASLDLGSHTKADTKKTLRASRARAHCVGVAVVVVFLFTVVKFHPTSQRMLALAVRYVVVFVCPTTPSLPPHAAHLL